MKKIKLDLQQFEGAEVLTRSQLKKVLGGSVVPMTMTNGCGLSCQTAQDCKGVLAGTSCSSCTPNNGGAAYNACS